MLCGNPMGEDGGLGISIHEVGDMTVDQILLMFADRKFLKSRAGCGGSSSDPLMAASTMADDDGNIKGRAADGTPITAKIKGKSVARQLMEKQAAEKEGR